MVNSCFLGEHNFPRGGDGSFRRAHPEGGEHQHKSHERRSESGQGDEKPQVDCPRFHGLFQLRLRLDRGEVLRTSHRPGELDGHRPQHDRRHA